jgi:peptide chain release factor 2
MTGPYDGCNAFVTFKAGAGGNEAEDWCLMAMRMYTLLFKKIGYTFEMVHASYGGHNGLKTAILHVKGPYAYGYLKGEAGNHRLTRISPYESKNRRQTSFCGLSITPEVERSLDVELNKKDIREDLFRSSGPGGQHANKTETGVRLTHLPTGLVASCQSTRSQSTNRERAEALLISKLVSRLEDEHKEESERLAGEQHEIGWGRKVRNYCFVPQPLVKDDRTKLSTSNLRSVLDGNLDEMIQAHILSRVGQEDSSNA